jgi:hypothetical protein
MSIGIGLGISLGTSVVGAPTVTDAVMPATTMSPIYSMVSGGIQTIAASDFAAALAGMTVQGVSLGSIGVTDSSGVTAWSDISAGAHPWAQVGAAGTRLTYTVTDATLGGHGSLAGDGVGRYITNAWDPPTPTSGSVYVFMRLIAKQVARVTNGQLVASQTQNRLSVRCGAVSPNVFACNGVTGADRSMALGQWFAVDVGFANDVADFLWFGSGGATTTLALGNTNPTALGLCATAAGAGPGNFVIGGAILATSATRFPDAGERTNLNAITANWFKGSVTLPS